MKKFLNNQEGQTIAAVILIMVIALGIGVTLSVRNVNRLRQQTSQSNADRALGVAEAAVERMLEKDYETLIDYINFDSCGTDCTLDILGDDGLNAHADVTLSMAGNSSDPYRVELDEDSVVEAALDTYPDNTDVNVCWNDSGGEKPSIVAQLVKGTSGNYEVDSYAYNSVGSLNSSNNFADATSSLGYDNCFTVDSSSNPIALRLKAVYNEVTAFVVPSGTTTLPTQGILIESVGTVMDSQRKVEVLLSDPYLPAAFDYVLYQKAIDSPLSN